MENAKGLVDGLRLKDMGECTTMERALHKARIKKAKADLKKAIKETGNGRN